MTPTQACDILGIEIGTEISTTVIVAAYRRAAMKYHPDKGGSTEMMQAVNEARATLETCEAYTYTDDSEAGYGDSLNAAINAIITLPGLSIEICGLWGWVSGDTRTHKEVLKAAGYRWASKKFQWYFRPDGWKSSGRGGYSMDEIRATHGSKPVASRRAAALA